MSYLNLLVCTMCLFLKNSLLCLNKDVCFIWAWIAYVVWMGWNWKRMGDSGESMFNFKQVLSTYAVIQQVALK